MGDKTISKVRLLSVPFGNDYKNTPAFLNVTNQASTFELKSVFKSLEDEDFSYIRKDNTLRYPKHIDELQGKVNYVMYQNKYYDNKWFYAFITKMEYLNDNNTLLHLETDVMQTWMFEYQVKQSFVEREHTINDSFGRHTLEEGLETGEYVCSSYKKVGTLGANKIIIASTVSPNDDEDVGATYGGVYSGVKYYTFDTEASVSSALQHIADGHEGAVSSVFMAPSFLIESSGGIVTESKSPKYETYNLPESNNFQGQHTVINQKLNCYPYRYILATNGNGASAIYRYEDFDTKSMIFKIMGTVCPGMSIRMVPMNYKGVSENFDEGLNLGKYPQCNWATDSFTNWMTQNAVNVNSSVLSAGAGLVSGAINGGLVGGPMGAIGGGIAGGISGGIQIAQAMQSVKNADMVPPQAQGNTNCGDIVTSSGNNTFHFYQMSIKPEYARLIDKYFSTYGYKTNEMKLPNKWHRRNYWYTRTIDVNIDGTVPINDLNKIKSCYNNGITFWTNINNINDYSVDNDVYNWG